MLHCALTAEAQPLGNPAKAVLQATIMDAEVQAALWPFASSGGVGRGRDGAAEAATLDSGATSGSYLPHEMSHLYSQQCRCPALKPANLPQSEEH
jgi:hypothetical protein